MYHNDPKFSDEQVWENGAEEKEQSDQGLHCSFSWTYYSMIGLLYGKTTLFDFGIITATIFAFCGCLNCSDFQQVLSTDEQVIC